ncbi:hypothetical protein BC833DRAFT_618685 [Globomyces pollinis-pini]|nr:hypothetical protein BC833DRAFT_618685 [Globomyces pollinis-pini]
MFKVTNANEYLVITGLNIPDIKVVRKAIIWPGQRYTQFSLTPLNYTLSLHAMTIEKLEFTLPAVFTIGPEDTPESIMKYARLLAANDAHSIHHIQELVTGIVEGETRVIAAGMTMEEIFKERKFFKEHVLQGVQSELNQFGMIIYNANVKQLQDAPGSEYFKYLRLKSQEGAINQAKVDVAQAQMIGAVGEKEREAEQRKNIIEIEATTVIYEQNRKVDIAKAQSQLETEQTILNNNVKIAEIESEKKAALREAELQRNIEIQNALVTQERERADKLSKTVVEAEMIQALADAELYKAKSQADAKFYEQQRQADAMKVNFEAQAEGLKLLHQAFNGDSNATLQFLMLDRGIYQDLAKANAEAVKGMSPKISVWNTGNENSDTTTQTIRDVYKSLPPLMSIINEQTGIKPPGWVGTLPTEQ